MKTAKELEAERIKAQEDKVALREKIRLKVMAERAKGVK